MYLVSIAAEDEASEAGTVVGTGAGLQVTVRTELVAGESPYNDLSFTD